MLFIRRLFVIPKQIWYFSMPVGYRALMMTVNRLCKSASIDGYEINHSWSIDGVRTYERVSEDQQQVLSNVLNRTTEPPPTKKVKTAESQENAKATPPYSNMYS